jgi:hypothetical protein
MRGTFAAERRAPPNSVLSGELPGKSDAYDTGLVKTANLLDVTETTGTPSPLLRSVGGAA